MKPQTLCPCIALFMKENLEQFVSVFCMLMSIFHFHVHIGACFISMLLCCHLAQKAQGWSKVLEEAIEDFQEVLKVLVKTSKKSWSCHPVTSSLLSSHGWAAATAAARAARRAATLWPDHILVKVVGPTHLALPCCQEGVAVDEAGSHLCRLWVEADFPLGDSQLQRCQLVGSASSHHQGWGYCSDHADQQGCHLGWLHWMAASHRTNKSLWRVDVQQGGAGQPCILFHQVSCSEHVSHGSHGRGQVSCWAFESYGSHGRG